MERDLLEPGDVEIEERVLDPAEEELERQGPSPSGQHPFMSAEEIEEDVLDPAEEERERQGRSAQRPFMSAEEIEAEIEQDARDLLAESRAATTPPTAPRGDADHREARADAADAERALAGEARALLRSGPLPADGARPLLTDEELDADRATDAKALLADDRETSDPAGPLLSDDDVESDLAGDARALLATRPEGERPLITEDELDLGSDSPLLPPPEDLQPPSIEDEEELHEFVLALGRREGVGRSALGAIFFDGLDREELRRVAGGLHPRYFSPGEIVISEGKPGSSVFLIASGMVRVLVVGGHGQPFEIRQIEEGDFFGEVAALSGRPRSATVVAASACEMLEIERDALETLVALRPDARTLLDQACVERALSPEESAVRSLPPEAADPARAAAALRAHFGDCNWSPRVRLHLSRLMLDVGRQGDALAILAGVAEDLARNGHAQKAIAVLKKVETIQRRGIKEVPLAPLKAGRRTSSARRASKRRGAPRAVKEAAFREWVGSLLRETAVLAERSAAAVQEEAEGAGEEQRRQLAG
jgi:CRP-like cAMP-binding protein